MDLNTCFETTSSYHTIAYYSHLIPVALALFLGFYALFKSKFSRLSVVFFLFVAGFSLWLLGDLVTWTSPNYHLVYFTWSWLDYVNVFFFLMGAYFFGVLSRGKISLIEKGILTLVAAPAFILTAMGYSLVEFNQPVCEAVENDLLTTYKLFAEGVASLMILLSFVLSWKASDARLRLRHAVVMVSILLFFVVFSSTEYIATITVVYEINLYGLFVLPFFLIAMVFSITNLGVFDFRLLGSQILAYALIIMSGSQFLFLQDATESTLSLVTLVISFIFALMLLYNAQEEEKARLKIEQLAAELDVSNKQQVILLRFITHQVKGFLTKSRNIFSLIKEGEFGECPEAMKPMIEEGFKSDTKGVNTIQEILSAANIKSGKVTYTMASFDLKTLIEEIIPDLKPAADAKGVALNLALGDAPIMISGDRGQLINAFRNLIDNSIKYTPKGSITVSLSAEKKRVHFEVVDTGVGITKEDMSHLFTEGGHGKDSQRINVESTGFGLYIVKNIIEAHGGKVWAESEGAGKGAKFIAELPA